MVPLIYLLIIIILQIAVGDQSAKIPGSESEENPRGLMVEIYWDKDDSGDLHLASISKEMPISRNDPVLASSN